MSALPRTMLVASVFFLVCGFSQASSASARAYLITSTTGNNETQLHILNADTVSQSFRGTLYDGAGTQLGPSDVALHTGQIKDNGRAVLSANDIEDLFGTDPWTGPAMLEVKGEGSFDLMTKLKSRSGLISNTNCVTENEVHNLEGFDSVTTSFVRLINTGSGELKDIRGSLLDSNGQVIGTPSVQLADSLLPNQAIWLTRTQLSELTSVQWLGTASMRIDQPQAGLKLLNLNLVNGETFFNFTCFETADSGRAYLLTNSASRNKTELHLINTSSETASFTGQLFGEGIEATGSQALTSESIPAGGRVVLSAADFEEKFSVSAWSGPAMLALDQTSGFSLMTRLTSPSGLVSNTNCVRAGNVQNLEGHNSDNMTYVRFINIGSAVINNIRGTLYDKNGDVVGAPDTLLFTSLAAGSADWLNRNQLSEKFGATWNDEATLTVTSDSDATLRLLNLNLVNGETFFNFSCYEQHRDSIEVASFDYQKSEADLVVALQNQTGTTLENVKVQLRMAESGASASCDSPVLGTHTIETIKHGEAVTVRGAQVMGQTLPAEMKVPGDVSLVLQVGDQCDRSVTGGTRTLAVSIAEPIGFLFDGLHGFIGSSSVYTPEDFRVGASFYSAVWPLRDSPLASFQIGLPGTWFIPDNSDNETEPLCPEGTNARDNFDDRAPTYRDVYQTIEGGLGYWAGNRFHYGPPKFSMNSTADCYSTEVASPGWGFFWVDAPLADHELGVAQFSNRLLIPPDGLPFDGSPNGEFFGYGFLALPLTPTRSDAVTTGSNNWMLFVNAANFKGPVAYYVPEHWSRIAKNHSFAVGRGLDSRQINYGLGGTMELNTVPLLYAPDKNGDFYTKIPALRFPINLGVNTALVRELSYYSKDALYNDVLALRQGGDAPTGKIAAEAVYYPEIRADGVSYTQAGYPVVGINELAAPHLFNDNVFGLEWSEPQSGVGSFPEYFKLVNNQMIAVNETDVPPETFLVNKAFDAPAPATTAYSALPLRGAWSTPGPASEVFEVSLNDCSIVSYQWYRFIDQPTFQQFNWSDDEKNELQGIVEKLHSAWTIDQEYLPSLKSGSLASLDAALIVTPPAGKETGYVPIVVQQRFDDQNCKAE